MQTLQEWPLNEAFSFTMPSHLMSMSNNEIINTILRVYREWRLRYSPLEYFPWQELAHDIQWAWHSTTNVPLPRRIAAKLNEEFNYKLSSQFWGELGNTLRERIPAASQFILRIVNRFNWKSGTYGDHGSCMWDGRYVTKDAMSASGNFYALQFFSDSVVHSPSEEVKIGDVTYYSQGRCWVYPTVVTLNGVDEYIVLVFNSYGGKPLQTMATIVQGLISGNATRRISVSNNNKTCGGIYVNGGGGMIAGSEAACKLIGHLDFSLKNSYDGSTGNLRTRVQQAGELRTATGANINLTNRTTTSKKKPYNQFVFNSTAIQKQIRDDIRRQVVRTKRKEQQPNYRSIFTSRRGMWAPQGVPETVSVRTYIKNKAKTNAGYRGTTRNEAEMYKWNRNRIANMLFWRDRIDDEFPRWSRRQRAKFIYDMTKHHYDIWTHITHYFNKFQEV